VVAYGNDRSVRKNNFMNDKSFYYILPELAVSIAMDKDRDALLLVKKYCDGKEWIQVELESSGQLNLSTRELHTAIYCGLDPIAIICCVGLVTIGRAWWATSLFQEVLEKTKNIWNKRHIKEKREESKQLKLF